MYYFFGVCQVYNYTSTVETIRRFTHHQIEPISTTTTTTTFVEYSTKLSSMKKNRKIRGVIPKSTPSIYNQIKQVKLRTTTHVKLYANFYLLGNIQNLLPQTKMREKEIKKFFIFVSSYDTSMKNRNQNETSLVC